MGCYSIANETGTICRGVCNDKRVKVFFILLAKTWRSAITHISLSILYINVVNYHHQRWWLEEGP